MTGGDVLYGGGTYCIAESTTLRVLGFCVNQHAPEFVKILYSIDNDRDAGFLVFSRAVSFGVVTI